MASCEGEGDNKVMKVIEIEEKYALHFRPLMYEWTPLLEQIK